MECKSAYLNVNGLDITIDGDAHYSYKLPFAIQMRRQPICTRLGWICCPCLCVETSPKDSMDFVNQKTGDQIRYHRIGKRVHVFHNGQYQGHLKRTWKVCPSTRTCCGDMMGQEQGQFSMFDKDGHKIGELTRPGKGCCCKCYPNFPCRCVYGQILAIPQAFFSCCSCTIECWPAAPKLTTCPLSALNGVPTCGVPHNCLFCDIVCCECCVKGPKKVCGCTECPCICCPNCCYCIFCAAPCPVCECRELDITSTFKFESLNMCHNGKPVGSVQLQYRGNCPFKSGYTHDPESPFIAAMEMGEGGMAGLVASSILVARSYALGLAAPLLSGLNFANKSPEYDGEVMTVKSDEVNKLLDALDANNMVTKQVRIGYKQVQGYTLIEVGYDNSWLRCGPCMLAGGRSLKNKSCTNKAETERLIKLGREGGTRPTFFFKFYMEDPEKEILNRDTAIGQVDNKFYDFFFTGGREQVRCGLACVRFYRFPCDFTVDKNICCTIPCTTRMRKRVVDEAGVKKSIGAPNQVVMTIGKAWAQQEAAKPEPQEMIEATGPRNADWAIGAPAAASTTGEVTAKTEKADMVEEDLHW